MEMEREFREWANKAKEMIHRRLGRDTNVWMVDGNPYGKKCGVISIGISFCEGLSFWFSLHQAEFDKNNGNQRRSLMRIRRRNMLATMEDFRKEMLRVIRKLK